MSQNATNSSVCWFHCEIRVHYLAVFISPSKNFLILNFIQPVDLFHSSHYPHFKGLPGTVAKRLVAPELFPLSSKIYGTVQPSQK